MRSNSQEVVKNMKRTLLAIAVLLLGIVLNGCLVIRTHRSHPHPNPYNHRQYR